MSRPENQDIIKQRVQGFILTGSVLLMAGKFLAFFMTHSVAILSDAMESIVNVIAGCISYYSLRFSAMPKDKSHPFGHGKAELISASVEGLLIATAGLLMISEGARRFFRPSEIAGLDLGIAIIAFAGAVNWFMGWYSIRIGRQYSSIALVAGGKHLHSDTYSTIGLVIGLILLYITKWSWIDSLLAILFGILILVTGFSILKKTVANLIDEADTEILRNMAEAISRNRQPDWIDIHNTKVIKYGSHLHVDCDLTLPWYYTVARSHEACERLNKTLSAVNGGRVTISVHSDPCGELHCQHCAVEPCDYRRNLFEKQEELTLSQLIESDEERNE